MAKGTWRCSLCGDRFKSEQRTLQHLSDYHKKPGRAEPMLPGADEPEDSEAANYIRSRYGVEI